MDVINKEVQRFYQKLNRAPSPDPPDNVNLTFQNQMSSVYKQDERNLRNIISEFTSPAANKQVNLRIIYRNRKLSSIFIKNNCQKQVSPSHVVYQYKCNNEECQPSNTYIGYTTLTIKQRMSQHAQNGGILAHNREHHDRVLSGAEMEEQTVVLYSANERQDLIIAEALFIKSESPQINNQREGDTRILKIF